MPSIYAHYLFGEKCIAKFPQELQKIVKDNRKFYDLGTAGGDLLFYFKPYKKNDVRSYGSKLHRENVKAQLEDFREKAVDSCTKESDIAFLAGYYTHFILDSRAHPFIEKMQAEGVAKHFVIETDYDRKLLIKYGEDPFDNKYLRFQVSDSSTQEVVAKYLNTTPKNIKKTLKDRKKYLKYISKQNKLWRKFLIFVFKASGNEAGLDILIQKDENDKCVEVRNTLDKLAMTALSEVEKTAGEFWEFVAHGKKLGDRFDCDFYLQ
ncbi:MAG: zinc dependent phospholipase C family protein [Clostridia bacterium]|nr:zinc dependent phospholipase C family protein [Clostridia bacterium]